MIRIITMNNNGISKKTDSKAISVSLNNKKRLLGVLSQFLEVDTWPLDLSCMVHDFLVWSCTK